MQFVYFVPTGTRTASREDVKRCGLEYALPGRTTSRHVTRGPDGSTGCVLAHQTNEPIDLGYYPQRQTWQQVDGSDAWVGFENASLPVPSELERDRKTPLGKWLELHDGNQWWVPIAQQPREQNGGLMPVCVLPQKTKKVDGEWVAGGVTRQYEPLWMLACQVLDYLLASGGETSIEMPFEWATNALAANYRVGSTEVGILGLFESDGEAVWKIVYELIDLNGWEQLTEGKFRAAS